MRVVVAGAAGFLGLATVRAFRAAGHDVVGLARDEVQAARIRSAGGTPARGDLLVSASLAAGLHGAEVVIHLAQPSRGPVELMREVRVRGGENLIAAATTARVRRLVVGSGYWVYADNPGTIREDSPLAPLSLSRVNFESEELARAAMARGSLEAVVLRPGMVYGPGSWFREMVSELRGGRYRHIGDGSNFMSPVHHADTGEAFRVAAERGASGATYLVVDDTPVPVHEFASFVAERLGAPSVGSISWEEASEVWGPDLARLNAASRRASNLALRGLGWVPKFGSYREGVPPVLAEIARLAPEVALAPPTPPRPPRPKRTRAQGLSAAKRSKRKRSDSA